MPVRLTLTSIWTCTPRTVQSCAECSPPHWKEDLWVGLRSFLQTSIDCFETLVSKFETQFDINRPHHLTSIALVNIHQEKRRSLRTFMDRFGKVALNILNWSSYMAMYHIVTALRSVPFADSLCMEPATNFDELRQRTAKLMQLEELREFRNQAWAEAGGDKGREKENERQNWPSAGRGDRHGDNRGSRFTRYTPLSADRGKILDDTLTADLNPQPRRAASPENVDQTCRCRYYRNSEHTTEECQALKDKIEELIQVRHLRRFVQGAEDRSNPHEGNRRRGEGTTLLRGRRRPEHRPRRENPLRREGGVRGGWEVINTIARGFARGGSSNNVSKKHLRTVQQVNTISFRPRISRVLTLRRTTLW